MTACSVDGVQIPMHWCCRPEVVTLLAGRCSSGGKWTMTAGSSLISAIVPLSLAGTTSPLGWRTGTPWLPLKRG